MNDTISLWTAGVLFARVVYQLCYNQWGCSADAVQFPDYWHNDINIAVWITIMIVVIVGLNSLPVKYYGESEFWFASLKVICLVGLLCLGFILFWGGGPHQNGILGFSYWKNPGSTNVYLKTGAAGRTVAFFSTLVLSAFPFTFAPELLVVTGGEMQSPRRKIVSGHPPYHTLNNANFKMFT